MNPGAGAVLLTMGFAVVLAIASIVVALRRDRQEKAQVREAQAGLPARSHARMSAAAAAAAPLAGPLESRAGQPNDAVAASHPPDLAVTATHDGRQS